MATAVDVYNNITLQSADGVCFISRGASAGRCVLWNQTSAEGPLLLRRRRRRRLPLSVRMRNTSTSTQQYYIYYYLLLYTHSRAVSTPLQHDILLLYCCCFLCAAEMHCCVVCCDRFTGGEYKTENIFFTRVFIHDRTNRVRVHYTRIKCNIGLGVSNKL